MPAAPTAAAIKKNIRIVDFLGRRLSGSREHGCNEVSAGAPRYHAPVSATLRSRQMAVTAPAGLHHARGKAKPPAVSRRGFCQTLIRRSGLPVALGADEHVEAILIL